jgi:hypothetical protein
VREALHERGAMLANAPHVAQRLGFVMPGYHWWERAFYGVGLKAYDALAGSRGLGGTEWLSSQRVRELLPGVQPRGLWGGVKYWDGQFDDARLAVLLARTAAARGALVVNHCAATELLREDGKVRGVRVRDSETGAEARLRARCVVNAAGVWVDAVRDMDREAGAPSRPAMVAPSQGVHLVVDRAFLPGTRQSAHHEIGRGGTDGAGHRHHQHRGRRSRRSGNRDPEERHDDRLQQLHPVLAARVLGGTTIIAGIRSGRRMAARTAARVHPRGQSAPVTLFAHEPRGSGAERRAAGQQPQRTVPRARRVARAPLAIEDVAHERLQDAGAEEDSEVHDRGRHAGVLGPIHFLGHRPRQRESGNEESHVERPRQRCPRRPRRMG